MTYDGSGDTDQQCAARGRIAARPKHQPIDARACAGPDRGRRITAEHDILFDRGPGAERVHWCVERTLRGQLLALERFAALERD